MVYQLVDGSPVKVLQVQILSDDRRPVLNGGGFLLCLIYLGQKRIQAFRLGKPLLFVLLRQHHECAFADCAAILILIKFRGHS